MPHPWCISRSSDPHHNVPLDERGHVPVNIGAPLTTQPLPGSHPRGFTVDEQLDLSAVIV